MIEASATLPGWCEGPAAQYWRRILIANTAGALAAFGLLGGLVLDVSWSVRWHGLVASFVYANCIGAALALGIPRMLRRCEGGSTTTRWVVRLITIPVLIVAGCLLAGSVLIVAGLSRPAEYLHHLYDSLWVSFVVGTIAALTVIGYESLRRQLETTSLALRTKQLEEEHARKLALEAQLASLESRVQPHFLFNTLNSIAALVHDDPQAAERVVGQLASLMRSALDSASTTLTPLDQELRLVRDYLEIERVRFGDRLRYQIESLPEAAAVLVPPLSLQTLVENSVKFAVSPRRQGASIVVRCSTTDLRVQLQVEDDGPGFDTVDCPPGHGLALLRDRLAMAFGDRASLRIDSREGRTSVVMDLPRVGSDETKPAKNGLS